MEAFSSAYNGSHAPILKTLQIWANEVFTVDILAVEPDAAHKISSEFWDTFSSLLDYIGYVKTDPKAGFNGMEFRATVEMFEPARSNATMAMITKEIVYDWQRKKLILLPVDVEDIKRFALHRIPDQLKPRIVRNKHLLCMWPIPLGRKNLTISSRVNHAVGVGAWRCRGYLSMDSHLSKSLFSPILSLSDICVLFLKKIMQNLSFFFSDIFYLL